MGERHPHQQLALPQKIGLGRFCLGTAIGDLIGGLPGGCAAAHAAGWVLLGLLGLQGVVEGPKSILRGFNAESALTRFAPP